MKVKEFNEAYKLAQTVNVVEDVWFNMSGWFWMQLTEKQLKKMYELMLEQGALESVWNGRTSIQLKNGLRVIKIWEEK